MASGCAWLPATHIITGATMHNWTERRIIELIIATFKKLGLVRDDA